MAKQYYTPAEAQTKLGMSAEELKELVRDGQLREFRDSSGVRYKADEVDGLAQNLATLSGSLGGTSGELILEPADETSMGLTGSDMLTLDEAERTEGDATVIGDTKEDTVITSVGISVFDDEDTDADPKAKTVMKGKDKSATDTGLSLTGTGSGLLDLTRESDDTSLGAELLDEIYSEDQEAGMPQMGDATRAGLEAVDAAKSGSAAAAAPSGSFSSMTRSGTQAGLQTEPAPVSAPSYAPRIVYADQTGPVESGLNAALLGAMIPMAIAGIAVSANIQGVSPSILGPIFQKLPIFGAVGLAIVGISFAVGFFLSKRGTR